MEKLNIKAIFKPLLLSLLIVVVFSFGLKTLYAQGIPLFVLDKIPPQAQAKVQSLIDEQTILFTENNKFKHIPRHKIGNTDFQVDEYIDANGNVGYQVITITNGIIESVGYGAEAEARTFTRDINELNLEHEAKQSSTNIID